MAKLEQYADFSEKNEYFKDGDLKIIINVDKIFDKLDELHSNGDFIFRGIDEAKYKLYNSAQRYYINSELFKHAAPDDDAGHYDRFIGGLVDECKQWNNSTVKNLLNASGIDENNSLAYLSYMQHFGVPTPLLDFTFNPYMALFFAVNGARYVESDNEIDNYFSLYYTYHNATVFEGWRATFSSEAYTEEANKLTYDIVSKAALHILLPQDEPYRILNNTNIINQQGLFIYSSHAFKPLEQSYTEHVAFIKEGLVEKLSKEAIDDLLIIDTFAACFNIHKSLIPYIKKRLLDKGIAPDFVYPDPYKIKEVALVNATIQSLVTRK
ncbi:MAG: FRG domain-containing protein [Janthinobacterium lividum]